MRKIGFFDSGVGGLSIMKECLASFPYDEFLYLGDNARAPYGNRDRREIIRLTEQALNYLFDSGCDIVVVACNTASVGFSEYAPSILKQFPGKQIVEIVSPTVKFITQYNYACVGILATQATVDSGIYYQQLRACKPSITVISEPCPIWVPLVETNEHLSVEAVGFLRRHIDKIMLAHNVDAILLACTHYGLIARRLRMLYPNTRLITQGEIVCNHLRKTILVDSEVSESGNGPTVTYLTTGSKHQFDASASVFMGCRVESEKIFVDNTVHH